MRLKCCSRVYWACLLSTFVNIQWHFFKKWKPDDSLSAVESSNNKLCKPIKKFHSLTSRKHLTIHRAWMVAHTQLWLSLRCILLNWALSLSPGSQPVKQCGFATVSHGLCYRLTTCLSHILQIKFCRLCYSSHNIILFQQGTLMMIYHGLRRSGNYCVCPRNSSGMCCNSHIICLEIWYTFLSLLYSNLF